MASRVADQLRPEGTRPMPWKGDSSEPERNERRKQTYISPDTGVVSVEESQAARSRELQGAIAASLAAQGDGPQEARSHTMHTAAAPSLPRPVRGQRIQDIVDEYDGEVKVEQAEEKEEEDVMQNEGKEEVGQTAPYTSEGGLPSYRPKNNEPGNEFNGFRVLVANGGAPWAQDVLRKHGYEGGFPVEPGAIQKAAGKLAMKRKLESPTAADPTERECAIVPPPPDADATTAAA